MNEQFRSQFPNEKNSVKRIVGVISFMNIGGAQLALFRLARELRERGHNVEVWSLYEKTSSDIITDKIHTFIKKPSLSLFEYLKVYLRLVSRLKQMKPDVVIGFLPLGNVFGLSAAALTGVPRRVASQRSPGTSYGKVIRILDRILGASKAYHSVVCVSEAVRASFSGYPRRYTDKISVIYNGVNWTPSNLDKDSARDYFSLPRDQPLIVTAGRLENEKNQIFLIKVLSEIKPAYVAIAGDGKLRAALEKLAYSSGLSGRISFLGNLDQVSISHLLKAADIFVQPSLYEGQSNAMLEAMHAGLPIIASDIPAHRETLCDEKGVLAGILVPPDDMQGWVKAVKHILNDSLYAGKLGKYAMESVQKRFPVKRMIDEFEKILTN